ncbi:MULTISPECIES: sensor histidine kinase [unclassified Streptomyces]|uniref:sensor histidine kinase n=1 Tax=unclassified Streptomyces TaxID=2593676 RepID=UPI0016609CD9|nr:MULTISPECIES: histidine kinase [unclassified Streptomyces]MBD0712491.1 two-component sensor histidine kinase [Streptomyces sp. CBMA291]MBD0716865.1 two-component sensor histidine kinase [Streptomyces sp. CBMA370]
MTTQTTAPSRYADRLITRIRSADAARPWLWDGTLTSVLTCAALVDASAGWRTEARDPTLPPVLIVTLSLALALPLLARRRRPTTVLAVMAVPALVSEASGAFLQAGFLQLLPLFQIVLSRPPRRLAWAFGLLAVPLVTGAVRFDGARWDLHVLPMLWAAVLVTLAGITVRSRRDRTAGLVDRARRLEVERDQEVRLAAAAERARIAREMHDIIGHNLAVITGLADGGRYAAARSPERAAQALDAIGTTSRQALDELRRLLDVLSTPDDTDDDTAGPTRTPQPTLADLPALLEGVRKAGLPVTAELPDPLPALPPGAQLTVYRVVQESLTNTLKHAGPGATATVLLSRTPDGLLTSVTDTGTPSGLPGQGQGLTGMRERAALYDGTLDSGPLPAGTGWRVRLHLPAAPEDPRS